jgi:regulator of nonsense transcripts 3
MPSIKEGSIINLITIAAAGKEPPVVTPLMVYVRQQRAAKSMAQRSGSSRLSRKVAGVVTSSPSPSKRGSEKRRTSASTVNFLLEKNSTILNGHKRWGFIFSCIYFHSLVLDFMK